MHPSLGLRENPPIRRRADHDIIDFHHRLASDRDETGIRRQIMERLRSAFREYQNAVPGLDADFEIGPGRFGPTAAAGAVRRLSRRSVVLLSWCHRRLSHTAFWACESAASPYSIQGEDTRRSPAASAFESVRFPDRPFGSLMTGQGR